MLKFLKLLKLALDLVIVGAVVLMLYRMYRLGHETGYKQGQFDSRFECEQAKAAAVDEAVRMEAGR